MARSLGQVAFPSRRSTRLQHRMSGKSCGWKETSPRCAITRGVGLPSRTQVTVVASSCRFWRPQRSSYRLDPSGRRRVPRAGSSGDRSQWKPPNTTHATMTSGPKPEPSSGGSCCGPPVPSSTETPASSARRRWHWRRSLVRWHRDIGLLTVGLTLVYVVSGILLNHRHQFDPNHRTDVTQYAVGRPDELLRTSPPARRRALRQSPTELTDAEVESLVAQLGERFEGAAPPRNFFWRGPERLLVFLGPGDADTLEYRPAEGRAQRTRKTDRWLLRDLNLLHLNAPHATWTYIADAYAVLLAFLAVSGALIPRGRRGLGGRGALLLTAGVALPVVAILLLRSW